MTTYAGERNPNWRGGRRPHNKGYVQVYAPDHPAACHGVVLEHRLVVEQALGRTLGPDEVVHHINGDKLDNRPGNLAVMSPSEHARLHYPTALALHGYIRPPAVRVPRDCEWCGDAFEAVGKRGSGQRFCSKRCYWDYRVGRGQIRKGTAA